MSWQTSIGNPGRRRLAAILAAAVAAAGAASAQSETVLVRGRTIHTVTGGTLRDGEILIRDGVIEAVGGSLDAPAGVPVYEAEVVIPGLIDAHAHVALDRSSRSRIPGPVTAEWKAVEHLDLSDPMLQVALSGGVTSLVTRSGSGIISSGQAVALKLRSTPGPEMILKPYVDLKMAVRPLINLRPGETPQTVMGWYATADEYFRRAEAYVREQDAHAAGSGPAPERDERLEAFAAVIRGEVMVHAHSHYPSEVMMVLRLARKYGFFDRLALAHAEEIFPLTELLAGTEIVPVIGPMMIVQYWGDPEPLNLLKDLLDAGVHASIQTDMSKQHFKDFREYGAFLARHGLTDDQALEIMTINGARAMMLQDRVGSIEAGKDADLVLLDGHFLDLTADRVERVFVDGRLEYERDRVLQADRPRAVGPFGPVTGDITPEDDAFAITGAHVFTVSGGVKSGTPPWSSRTAASPRWRRTPRRPRAWRSWTSGAGWSCRDGHRPRLSQRLDRRPQVAGAERRDHRTGGAGDERPLRRGPLVPVLPGEHDDRGDRDPRHAGHAQPGRRERRPGEDARASTSRRWCAGSRRAWCSPSPRRRSGSGRTKRERR